MDIEDYSRFEDSLIADGWWFPLRHDEWMLHDRQMVERDQCPTCGKQLSCVQLVRPPVRTGGIRGYRGFAVCRQCNTATEF